MAKIIKNTTAVDIVIAELGGVAIPALGQYTLNPREYLYWAAPNAVLEYTPYILSGDLVVNDGVNDLNSFDGINFLEYPDTAFNARFLSDPERVNGFTAKNVQEAIEEAVTGTPAISPTTTTNNTPTLAYSQALVDDTAYVFDARVVARRTDAIGDSGYFQQVVHVKRESGGPATIVGDIFQKQATRSDSGMIIDWSVSGNNIELLVTGVNTKTIRWQPQIESEVT